MSNAIAAHLKAADLAHNASTALEDAITKARAAVDVHNLAAKAAADASTALGIVSGEVQSTTQKVVAAAKPYVTYALVAIAGASAALLGSAIAAFIK